MTGHPDRLAGLVVLTAILTGVRTVGVRGIPATSLSRAAGPSAEVADAPPSGGGAVVAAHDVRAAAAELEAMCGAVEGGQPAAVWVLWRGGGATAVHRAAVASGLVPVASYGYVGTTASPTHLVREGQGSALRWFAASARPRWGTRSGLARRGNHLPRIGPRFFDGRAVLFRAVGPSPLPWPGADFGGGAARWAGRGPAVVAGGPAVVHLGGGRTAGRVVLTWADGSGTPTHHTKLAPDHLGDGVVAEAAALGILAGLPSLAGSVPTLLELRHETDWAALTASHLPGQPPRAVRGRPAPGTLVRRPGSGPSAVDALVTAWVVALARASQGRASTLAEARRPGRLHRLARAVASLDDLALQSVVRRGLDLGATSHGLLHGDLWTGNVHIRRGTDGLASIAVLDWESALVGHPLVDLLTWLVSRAGRGEQVRERALHVLGGPSQPDHRRAAEGHVRTLLAALGQPSDPEAIDALVLAQMVVIAVAGGPAGGDGVHERAWLDAVHHVWASWQRAGGSPWSSRVEVTR